MSSEDTAAAIDLVARKLREGGVPEDAADAMATSIVGQLQSRFWIVPLVDEGATTRAELAAMVPRLFTRGGARS